MKSFLSVKGILVVLVLALVALGSGTALAGRQSAVSPQDSLVRLDGATIVTSSLCTKVGDEFRVWGSGWGSGELILLSVVKGASDVDVWFAGSVNAAGAFEVVMELTATQKEGTSAKFPGAGLMTLEALGTAGAGRLATAPVLFVEDKCPGADSMDSM